MSAIPEYEALVPRALESLIPTFLAQRRKDLEQLQQALEAGDFARLASLGHRMRGSSTSYGFPHIASLGRRIELEAKAGERSSLMRIVDEYRAFLANVRIRLA